MGKTSNELGIIPQVRSIFFICGWIIIYYGCHEGLTQSHMGELGDNNGIHMINHPQVGFSTSFCWLFMIGFATLHKLSEPQIYED